LGILKIQYFASTKLFLQITGEAAPRPAGASSLRRPVSPLLVDHERQYTDRPAIRGYY